MEDVTKWISCTVGILILFLGIAGNSLVVFAVWKKPSLRSTTNYLLVNLAISDTISLTFLPFFLIQSLVQLQEGPFADFLCKFIISFHVPFTASVVSVLTLSVLAVERYHAIVKPMRSGMRLREDTVRYAILAVWLTGIVLTLPVYVFGCYQGRACIFDKDILPPSTRFIIFVLCAIFLVITPFLVMSYCYFQIVRELYFKKVSVAPQNVATAQEIQDKRKLVRIVFMVTLAYIVCFFPVIVTYSLWEIGVSSLYFKIAAVLYFCEPVVNPLLYGFQSSNFRQAFKDILKCRRHQV